MRLIGLPISFTFTFLTCTISFSFSPFYLYLFRFLYLFLYPHSALLDPTAAAAVVVVVVAVAVFAAAAAAADSGFDYGQCSGIEIESHGRAYVAYAQAVDRHFACWDPTYFDFVGVRRLDLSDFHSTFVGKHRAREGCHPFLVVQPSA